MRTDRCLLLAALSLVPLLGGADQAHAQTWKELGPAPISNGDTGRVSALATSPSDPDLYYLGGADGGVWRTRDGGATWTPLTDTMPTTAIGAIAVDPSNEQVLYVGTGEANHANHSRYGLGLYKSRDGGDTWTHLGQESFAGRCFSRLLVHPTRPKTLYASLTRAGGFPELAAAKGHPGAKGPVGVFRSRDGGRTWHPLTNGLPSLSATDLAMAPGNPLVLYAGIGRIYGDPQNGIYRSGDGGDTWTRLGGGLPTTDVGRIALAVAPSMPSRLYTLIAQASNPTGGSASTRGAWRSDDGGTTWTSLPVGSIQATYGWYLCVVGVNPSNADQVIMGGLSLVRSNNAGASFQTITPPHVDLHAVTWDASGRLLVGDDGGIHRSTNSGRSWSSLNNGLGIIQFYAGLSTHPTNPLIVYGGTQDNGSHRRGTNTRSWTQVFGGDGGWTQVDQTNPSTVFVELQGTGLLYRSTSGGTGGFNFRGSGLSGRNCFLPPYVFHPQNPNTMYYGTHRLYRTTNQGGSWSVISGDLTTGTGAIRALAIAPSDPNVIYAATNDGNVQVSADGGQNFTLIRSGHPGWPRVTRELYIHPTDADTLYLATAAFGTTQVERTQDQGLTWWPLDMGLPDLPVNVIAVDTSRGQEVLFAGTDAGVYKSRDQGWTWRRFGQGLPNVPVIDLQLDVPRNRLLAGTQGRGAWLMRGARTDTTR